MDVGEDEIVIDKPPSSLDELILDVAGIFDDVGVEYAVVSGYVAVLLGRSRATEDIDVIVERFDEAAAGRLVERLRAAGYWGAAMPLADLYDTLADGLPVRIAEDGHRVPNVELKFPGDRFARRSLADRTTVRLGDRSIAVGCLELQIAYKLRMGARKDFEDALHLYHLLEPTLNRTKLEGYVEELGVEDEYDGLESG